MNPSRYYKKVHFLSQAQLDNETLNAPSLLRVKAAELFERANAAHKIRNYDSAANQCRAGLHICGVPKGFLKNRVHTPENIAALVDNSIKDLTLEGLLILRNVISDSQDIIFPRERDKISISKIEAIIQQLGGKLDFDKS